MEEIKKEYQMFVSKFFHKIKELREDFDKLSDINKQTFKENCKILLIAECPYLSEFLQND